MVIGSRSAGGSSFASILLLIAPLFFTEFYLNILCEALVMTMLTLSFNLLFGFMGQLSFGQAAFYGLGGYTVAMLMTKVHFNFWLSLAAGVVVAALIGLMVGFFCVRLRGIYFAILTLAFGQLIFFVIFKWHDFTGGDDGIQGVFPPAYLKSPTAYYFFILVVFVFPLFSCGGSFIPLLVKPLKPCVKIQKGPNSWASISRDIS